MQQILYRRFVCQPRSVRHQARIDRKKLRRRMFWFARYFIGYVLIFVGGLTAVILAAILIYALALNTIAFFGSLLMTYGGM